MKTKTSLFVLLLTVLLSISAFAQTKEIGKIFTDAEADSLYGKVIESYTMSSDSLLSLLKETGDKVMFRLKDNKVVIAGNNRIVLYPKGAKVTNDEELRVYSTSKVLELLASGRSDEVVVQFREVTTTLGSGNLVLEHGYPCPPFCE